jgi:3',5'-cyclic AMP phosphodiesterase CpdA
LRCHFLSDLHLERQDFAWPLPHGDVLIIAGDLCNASALDPAPHDLNALRQRDRVMRFADSVRKCFKHVLMVAGNHEHYDGVFDDTIVLLRRHLPHFTVLSDEAVEIGGVSFYGSTLWTNFEGGSVACMNRLRRGVGDYFFVKRRLRDGLGTQRLHKFQPEDALAGFSAGVAALEQHVRRTALKTVVITHHAPSLQGLNPLHTKLGRDAADASDLDMLIASLATVPFWVHGHTHIQRNYRIGETLVRANCRGVDSRDPSARTFLPDRYFDL